MVYDHSLSRHRENGSDFGQRTSYSFVTTEARGTIKTGEHDHQHHHACE